METITIYTDGSCIKNPGKGGWAFIAILPGRELHISGGSESTTNNIMELTAVIEALKMFSETLHELSPDFIIYSDSMYVINCAQGKWMRKKNLELWREYDRVSRGKRICYKWVKGHAGNAYNELVDQLAKNETK